MGTAAVGAGVVSGAMLTPDKAQASADGATTAFVEPKGNFAQKLLNDYLSVEVGKGNFPTAEDRLNFGGVYQKIEAPQSEWAAKAANWYARYNKTRKERLSPAVDMVLPFSELPADLATKLAYGDDLVEGDPKKAWQELRKGNYRNSLFELTKGDVTNALLGLF